MPKKPKKPPLTKKQQEQRDYADWMARVSSMKTGFAREKHPASSSVLEYKLKPPPGREQSEKYASFSTHGGGTAKPPEKQYTGTKMLGIGVLHKSNSVPVFSGEEAIDLARMRR
jgi:hypothetical protein